MRLIKFINQHNRKPVFINPEHVVALEPPETAGNYTVIQLAGPIFRAVCGKTEDVAKQLEQASRDT